MKFTPVLSEYVCGFRFACLFIKTTNNVNVIDDYYFM